MNVSVSEQRAGRVRHSRRAIPFAAAAGVWCVALLIGPEAAAQTAAQPGGQPTLSTNPAASQRARARDLGDRGLLAFDAGDYAGATALFRQALALYDFPTLRLYLARSLVKEVSPVEATRQYEALLQQPVAADEGDFGADARAAARRELPEAAARRVRLTLTLEGASPDGVRLEVSGRSAPVVALGRECLVEPGRYEIRVIHPDGRNITRSVDLTEGETRRVELDWNETTTAQPGVAAASSWDTTEPSTFEDDPAIAPASEAPPVERSSNVPAWITGVLTAGLAGGAIATGLLAAERQDDYDDRNRRPDVDAASKRDLRDKALQMQVLNAALSGAALIGGGVTLYFIVREPPAGNAQHAAGSGTLSSVASGWVFGVNGVF